MRSKTSVPTGPAPRGPSGLLSRARELITTSRDLTTGEAAPSAPTVPKRSVRYVPTAILWGHDGHAFFEDPDMNPSFRVDARTWEIQLASALSRSPLRPITVQKNGSGDGSVAGDWTLEQPDVVGGDLPLDTKDRENLVGGIILHFTRERDAAAQPTIRLDISFTDLTRELFQNTYNIAPGDNTSFHMLIPFSKESSSERFFSPAWLHNNVIAVWDAPDHLRTNERVIGIKGFLASGYKVKISTVGIASTYLGLLQDGIFSDTETSWAQNSNWPVRI